MLHKSFFALVLLSSPPFVAITFGQGPKVLEVELAEGRLAGMPIQWGNRHGILLEANGHLRQFQMPEVKNYRILAHEFVPQSILTARQQLERELGSRYETHAAAPYVIAAPRGTMQHWSECFRKLHRGFQSYFELRGWTLRPPDFPLMVIVYASHEEFAEAMHRESPGKSPHNLVGTYSPGSNRCRLYQIKTHAEVNWAETEATIVHEAVHQLAFNCGIHERLNSNPLWLVEGIATMFENSAVYDGQLTTKPIAARLDHVRVARLAPLLRDETHLLRRLRGLIEDDQLFSRDAIGAYDLSWALSFYLAERRPQQLRAYCTDLYRTAQGDQTPEQRLHAFRHAFHDDPSLIAVQIRGLMSEH